MFVICGARYGAVLNSDKKPLDQWDTLSNQKSEFIPGIMAGIMTSGMAGW